MYLTRFCSIHGSRHPLGVLRSILKDQGDCPIWTSKRPLRSYMAQTKLVPFSPKGFPFLPRHSTMTVARIEPEARPRLLPSLAACPGCGLHTHALSGFFTYYVCWHFLIFPLLWTPKTAAKQPSWLINSTTAAPPPTSQATVCPPHRRPRTRTSSAQETDRRDSDRSPRRPQSLSPGLGVECHQ